MTSQRDVAAHATVHAEDTADLEEALFEAFGKLAAIDAIPGHEGALAREIARRARAMGAEVSADGVGNVFAVVRAVRPGPVVLIAAHMDEIGCLVKSIEPDGYLRLEKLGGVVDALLPTRLVRVSGRITGVVGVKPGHLQSEQEKTQGKSIRDVYVDVGASSAVEVAALGIRVGDPVVVQQPPFRLGGETNLVGGKALDDRIGCAVLLQLLQAGVAPPAGTLVLAFTVQEEVGLRGAGAAAARWQPHFALALDTMPAGDTPDVNLHRELNVALGAGPAIQVLSRQAILPPLVRDFLLATAQAAGVRVQLCAFPQGANDSATLQWAPPGRPAGSICIPRRYSHTPAETCDMRDVIGAYQLLAAVVERMGALPSFDVLDEERD
jgi:putative aminopeptidase